MARKRRGQRAGRKRRRRKMYLSFAAALQERSGLRQTSFALPAAEFQPVQQAKRRFGPLAVARFIGTMLKALMRLCHTADHK